MKIPVRLKEKTNTEILGERQHLKVKMSKSVPSPYGTKGQKAPFCHAGTCSLTPVLGT